MLNNEYITSINITICCVNTPITDVNKFIAVKLSDGSFTFNNKNSNFKLDLTITLPEITQF
jgi:hypothetical protein